MESAPKSASKRLSYAINQSPLYRLKSHRKLAKLLGISVLDLRKFRHSEGMSTYRERLPTGSPLSPFLAFFAYCDTWEKIASIARAHGLTLTVYVDDVTLSGRRVPRSVIWEIEKIIYSSGLRCHKGKAYFDRPAEITGVIVDRERLLAPQRQHKKLHQAKLRLARAHGAERTTAIAKLSGLKGQIAQIDEGVRNLPVGSDNSLEFK